MTLIIKKIYNNKYYYYQDLISIKNNKRKKNKIITTYIGKIKTNYLDYTELVNARSITLLKHIINILKVIPIKTSQFIKYNSDYNDELILLEYLKIVYYYIKSNLNTNEERDFDRITYTKYVHGTTQIEGNTLSEEQTKIVLEKNLTPIDKSIDEVNEIRNYNLLRDFLNNNKDSITEKLIKKIHSIMVNGIIDIKTGQPFIKGEYRIDIATITDVNHAVSRPENINQDMSDLIEWYNNSKKMHSVELAAIFHEKYEMIHPFKDYNGRTGREILNFMLKRAGFPPIIVTKSLRNRYLDALKEGNFFNYAPIIKFILECIFRAMQYLFIEAHVMDQLLSQSFKEFLSKLTNKKIANKFITTFNVNLLD